MTIEHSTCLSPVQETTQTYQSTNSLLKTKRVTVQSTGYPPLKSDPGCGAWRRIPWINLRGFWLEQVGFEMGTPYTIEVYDKTLVFRVEK